MVQRLLTSLLFLLGLGVGPSLTLSAQTSDGLYSRLLSMSMSDSLKAMHGVIRKNLVDAAAAMSPADYAFRPPREVAGVFGPGETEVRTFGQLVGHVATVNFYFCAQASSQAPPPTNY